GIAPTMKTVRFAGDFTHKLGNEIDLKIAWELTKQVVIDAGVGFLFGSKVLEDSLGGHGAPGAARPGRAARRAPDDPLHAGHRSEILSLDAVFLFCLAFTQDDPGQVWITV